MLIPKPFSKLTVDECCMDEPAAPQTLLSILSRPINPVPKNARDESGKTTRIDRLIKLIRTINHNNRLSRANRMTSIEIGYDLNFTEEDENIDPKLNYPAYCRPDCMDFNADSNILLLDAEVSEVNSIASTRHMRQINYFSQTEDHWTIDLGEGKIVIDTVNHLAFANKGNQYWNVSARGVDIFLLNYLVNDKKISPKSILGKRGNLDHMIGLLTNERFNRGMRELLGKEIIMIESNNFLSTLEYFKGLGAKDYKISLTDRFVTIDMDGYKVSINGKTDPIFTS